MSAVGTLRVVMKAQVVKAERAAPQRLVLTPIPWGRRDSELGKAVCLSVLDTTPPLVIPFQPRTHARTRAFLRSHGVHC